MTENNHCLGCRYRRPASALQPAFTICHFLLDTGSPRGCPAESCTRWQPTRAYEVFLAQLCTQEEVG